MRKHFLTMLLGLGLVLSMFVGALGTASADYLGTQDVYFPWVPNGETLVGVDGQESGNWYGTVTVQNVEREPIEVDFYVGVPGEGYEFRATQNVDPYASTTVSAEDLANEDDGGGFSVRAVGYLEREDDEVDEVRANITGATRNMSPTPRGDGQTDGSHIEVDGYTAQSENHIGAGNHVLPIVQTNSGWNTDIKIANWAESGGSEQVVVTFYGAFGEGVSGDSSGELSINLDPGEVASLNLDHMEDELNLGEDFVGSAWISSSSSANISAVAERLKPEDDMLVINTSRPEGNGNSTKYAPLVFQNYNMWNTGISVANLSDSTNSVTIEFKGPTTASQISQTMDIPPQSMEYLYIPGVQELGIDDQGFVGSAIISSEDGLPFHASVDQVKYFGTGLDVGSAMSYIAEHETAGDSDPEQAVGDALALPIFQKGSDAGSGDTSGIQLFNASADSSVNAHITFYDQAGERVAPTTDSPRTVQLAPHESSTVYALDLLPMPEGFYGTAMINVSGDGELVGVSNAVNYDVAGDGAAAYNLIRVPGEPEDPTATEVEISPETSTDIWGDTHEITVHVADQFGNDMEGVEVDSEITEGPHRGYFNEDNGFSFHGATDEDGNFVIYYTGDLTRQGLNQDTIEVEVEGVHRTFIATRSWEYGDPANVSIEHIDHPEEPANVTHVSSHLVEATLTNTDGDLVEGAAIDFEVSGANDASQTVETDENGTAQFLYEGTEPGDDTITATTPADDNYTASVSKTWYDLDVQVKPQQEEANPVGSQFSVEAELGFYNANDEWVSLNDNYPEADLSGYQVDFDVDGDNGSTVPATQTTNEDGVAYFDYTGNSPGEDTVTATVQLTGNSDSVTRSWQ